MKYPHLEKAPIVEALIDIQCHWGNNLVYESAIEVLRKKCAGIKSEFPDMKEQISQQVAFNPDPTKTLVTKTVNGFQMSSESKLNIAQFRRIGFTFSRLLPYESWDKLQKDAKRLWQVYATDLGEISITRLATRYINRIRMPYPLTGDEDLLKGLSTPPTEPQTFSQVLSFVNQTLSVDGPSGSTVTTIRAMQPAGSGDLEVDVVLDIDVFRTVNGINASDDQIWKILDSFQEVKNRIFFGIIGKAIVERYR